MRKMLAFLLIAVLLLSAIAFAAPSVTVSQIVKPSNTNNNSNVQIKEDFAITLKPVTSTSSSSSSGSSSGSSSSGTAGGQMGGSLGALLRPTPVPTLVPGATATPVPSPTPTLEPGVTPEPTPVPVPEMQVFEQIFNTVIVEEKPVAEYFGEEVMAQAVAQLPEELATTMATESLVIDEFFALGQQNYEEDYGDITAAFEFATSYEDNTLLVALVGILPTVEEGVEIDQSAIVWIPLPAVANGGLVEINFTQDVMLQLDQNNCVLALLRAEELPAEMELIDAIEEPVEAEETEA